MTWGRPRQGQKCVFCGSTPVNSEHVFSRWTHKYLEPRPKGKDRRLDATQYVDRTQSKVTKLPGSIRDWQLPVVCGGGLSNHLTCNGGWMSTLEKNVKPALTKLILGGSTRISPKEQSLIAAWACMKAMIAEFDVSFEVTTHHTQRKRMRNIQKPPALGWGVWVGDYIRSESNVTWVSRPLFLIHENRIAGLKSSEVTRYNGNVTTQIIGRFLVHVIRVPPSMHNVVDRWTFQTPEGGTLFRIWPPTQFSISWPASPLTDTDAEYTADDFYNFCTEIAFQKPDARLRK